MYSFRKTQQFESKRYPGITAKIRPLTVDRRARLEMEIAAHPDREEYLNLLFDREEIKGDARADKLKRAPLNVKIKALENQQRFGPYIRECVESVEGFEAEDGTPGTPDTLVSEAPWDLCEEIVDFIDFDMRLSSVEEKNSSSRSGSDAPEPQIAQSTTA